MHGNLIDVQRVEHNSVLGIIRLGSVEVWDIVMFEFHACKSI